MNEFWMLGFLSVQSLYLWSGHLLLSESLNGNGRTAYHTNLISALYDKRMRKLVQ